MKLRGIIKRLSFMTAIAIFMLMTSSLAWGQTTLVQNTGTLGTAGFTEVALTQGTASSNNYLQFLQPNSSITSPVFSLDATTNEVLTFDARTFGTASAALNTITVSISTDNGATFTPLGTRVPSSNVLTAQTSFDLSGFSGSQVLIRIENPGSGGTRGVGIDNILVSGTPPPATVAPTITSANNATFTVGQAGTFTVTATGTPTPTLTSSGALPSGVTFTDNGNGTATIAGTPAAGTNGSYPITITASNGTAPDATQNFTLTVNPAPVTVVTVTAGNPQGFRSIATTGTGTVTFVVDPLAPAGLGALQLSTPDDTAKADFFRSTTTLLTAVTELSYFTKQEAGSPAESGAAYQLRVCLNGLNATQTGCNPSIGGGSSFSTLVFEPYLNDGINGNPVLTPGVYQQFDVDAGLFSSTQTVVCSNGTITGSSGSSLYTLLQLQTTCPEAFVFDFGASIGSNNAGFVVRTDLLNFNGTVFNFEPVGTTAAQAEINGRVMSGARGIQKVAVKISGGDLAEPIMVMTNTFGHYKVEGLSVGGTYVLQVMTNRYRFENPIMVVSLQDNIVNADFRAVTK